MSLKSVFPRHVLLLCALALPGCAGGLSGVARTAASGATAGAVAALTAPAATKALDNLAAGAASSAVAAARDTALGDATRKDFVTLSSALRAELLTTRDELLDPAAVSAALAPVVDDLRERALGAPLRADVDALIDEATPRLAAAVSTAVAKSLAPVRADVATTAEHYKNVALALAGGAALLLLALAFAVWELRRHRRVLAVLLHRAVP
jgi:hypothetical protein